MAEQVASAGMEETEIAETPGPILARQDDDTDSTYDADAASSTASIASSILKYRTINGRTYHSDQGDTQYWGPNDDTQNAVLDILNHANTLALDGKLYLAPLPDRIEKAIDIGTGTGIWAIDFADERPDTTVIGTDLSPIQPVWIPPNLIFEIENFNNWTFDANSVDYIHFRWLLGCVADWTALAKNAFATLKPGGWVEYFEFDGTTMSDDGTVEEDMAVAQWGTIFQEGFKKAGLKASFNPIREGLILGGLKEAGFTNIKQTPLKMPFSEWAEDKKLREMGLYTRAAFERDTRGTMNMPATYLGWSQEEVIVYCARLRKELRNLKIHPYLNIMDICAQKPF